jgi:betaine lipid synthase
MLLRRNGGKSHKERLDTFYAPQAQAYDRFRRDFLHGRQPMLEACGARLRGDTGMVWVDMGGGTAANVEMMSHILDLSVFDKIIVVDYCSSLCEVARQRVAREGWTNVEVVEGDACTFSPDTPATLITFSYSLSMIPDFMAAIDNAVKHLAEDGIVGVADFFTSAKYDLPNRQHSYLQRWFWRSFFDTDGIDVGPERRLYLEHRFEPVYEYNARGNVPYLPYLQAPYYQWIGRRRDYAGKNLSRFPARASDEFEAKRPPAFPPTFLYSLSWEDPREDDKYLNITKDDTVLTLTSGGCNALDLVYQGAGQVVGVDINPAQSYLLELKRVAIVRLPFEDVWAMFGEGVHPKFDKLLKEELAPFLSQGAFNFWSNKSYYFEDGLYYHGGMGNLIRCVRALARITRQQHWIDSLVNAPTLEKQKELWFGSVGKWLMQGNHLIRLFAWFVTNQFVLWFCAGVCKGQLNLIKKDDTIYNYVVRCLNSTAAYSHLRDSNYFYRCCLTGRFSRHCCPRFLEEAAFKELKSMLSSDERLLIRTTSFVDELRKRLYTKVILMDHVDWLEQGDIDTLCAALRDQVKPGGRVIWRSASRSPKYAKCIEKAGFDVIRITTSDKYMDRVNMYASFYVGIRQGGVSIEEMVDEKEEEKLPGSPNSVLNAANGLEQLQQ